MASPESARDCESLETTTGSADSASCLRHVRSSDGKLVPLVLQSFGEARHLPETSKWLRLGKSQSMATPLAKVSYWIGSPMLVVGSRRWRSGAAAVGEVLMRLIVAWPVSCILVYGAETFAAQTPYMAQPRGQRVQDFDERYDVVRLPKDDASNDTVRGTASPESPSPDRLRPEDAARATQSYSDNIRLSSDLPRTPELSRENDPTMVVELSDQGTASRPRYLCYIQDYDEELYETIHVSDFILKHGDNVDIEFVFVSYTREQFRVATDDEIDKYDKYPNEATREANRELANKDRRRLIKWGIDAAKKAGKRAFWIDFECVRDKDGVSRSTSKSDDVYRICDVVRAAHSMIIAIGPPASDKVAALLSGQELAPSGPEHTTRWLRHWGSRLWTLPELLLCPGEHRVKLYAIGDVGDAVALAKRNFAERAWEDAELVKELVNHYEGSAILTQLRLIETALACFARRGTDQFSPGDIAYAIMGLLPLRQRPTVRQGDSGFQAFARLSLANDGGDFLERLICLLPPTEDAPWYDAKDVWGAKVSDVRPSSQVASIAEGDTLLLDGVYGAAIRWDGFDASVRGGELATGWAWNTLMVVLAINAMFSVALMFPVLVSLALGEVIFSRTVGTYHIAVLLSLPTVAAFIMPLLHIASRRNIRSHVKAARLVGIEGHVDAAAIERHLWGFNHSRLTSVTSHAQFHDDEAAHQNGTQPGAGGRHALTLVDTHMMTVLHFYARNPPVAMFVAGREGGLQRALLCSYDWRRDVFVRETVLRVGTKVLDRMRRVDRFRLCLNAPRKDASGSNAEDGAGNAGGPADDAARSWKAELAFVAILLISLRVGGPSDVESLYDTFHQFYALSFAVAQIPAYFLLCRLSITRILPSVAILKAYVPLFYFASTLDYDVSTTLPVFEGAIDGILTPVLIAVIWSWYRPQTLPFRILVLAFFPRLFTLSIVAIFPATAKYYPSWARVSIPLYSILCLIVATGGMYKIGLPAEVSWLPAYEKVEVLRHAAASKYASTGDGAWAQQKRSWLRDPRPFILFAISFSIFIAADAPPTPWYWTGFYGLCMYGAGCLAVLVLTGIFLSRVQRLGAPLLLIFTIMAGLGTTLRHLDSSASPSFIVALLMSQREMILPLLWIVIAYSTESWNGGIGTLAFSLAGMAVAILLKRSVPLITSWKVSSPMAFVAVGLLGYLWVREEMGAKRRVACLRRETLPAEVDPSEETT